MAQEGGLKYRLRGSSAAGIRHVGGRDMDSAEPAQLNPVSNLCELWVSA